MQQTIKKLEIKIKDQRRQNEKLETKVERKREKCHK